MSYVTPLHSSRFTVQRRRVQSKSEGYGEKLVGVDLKTLPVDTTDSRSMACAHQSVSKRHMAASVDTSDEQYVR